MPAYRPAPCYRTCHVHPDRVAVSLRRVHRTTPHEATEYRAECAACAERLRPGYLSGATHVRTTRLRPTMCVPADSPYAGRIQSRIQQALRSQATNY